MPRWKNLAEAGETMFVSTTMLGFTPVFVDPRVADTMAAAIYDDYAFEGASLHAFVVMPEHLHLLLTVPTTLTGSELMDRLKSAWANRILDVIGDEHRNRLALANRKLRSRTVWQRSFRGPVIDKEEPFFQKVRYIHENPVRRGLCERPEDYAWSSAKLWENGMWDGTQLRIDDGYVSSHWPQCVREPLADIVRRGSATRGRVAR